jgi:NTP pyrophosphatase (non-canonical NTP hydrolase)
MKPATSIRELHQRLAEFRDRRNWKRFHTPKDLAISISIESAELLELFQWKSERDVEEARGSREFSDAAADEIADVLIYLVLLAGELGIDPIEAAIAKISANEERFPARSPEEKESRQ